MKSIKKTGKLQLNKETLRSLSRIELEAVNGASVGEGTFCPGPTLLGCDTSIITNPTLPVNSNGTIGRCTGGDFTRLTPIFPND